MQHDERAARPARCAAYLKRLLSSEALVHAAAPCFECGGQMLAKLGEELIVQREFFLPRTGIDLGQLGELDGGELVQPGPVEVLVARHDAERCFHAFRVALAALNDPLKHAHVFAEARPDELALRVAAEPVDAEDARRLFTLRPIATQWAK